MSEPSATAPWRTIILFGVAVWFVPFVLSFLLYTPEGQPRFSEDLFESVMAVSLAGMTALLSYRLFSRAATVAASGLVVGLVWLGISVAFDLAAIVAAFDMPLPKYLVDVALSYLMIPAITVAVAKTARARKSQVT
ncbi:MAG: hypothetical protein SFV19_18200 [Rhodospirillaceae bacterium]|nr:hypothetical protein [Rhodospirillaceae bacterium]